MRWWDGAIGLLLLLRRLDFCGEGMSLHDFLLCGIWRRVFDRISNWDLYPPSILLLMPAVKAGEKGRSMLEALFRSRGGGLSGLGSLLRMGIEDWRRGRGRCG